MSFEQLITFFLIENVLITIECEVAEHLMFFMERGRGKEKGSLPARHLSS